MIAYTAAENVVAIIGTVVLGICGIGGLFGSRLARKREQPGWVPVNVPPEPLVIPDVMEVGRYVHRADGIYLRWELYESPLVEAEREEGA